MKLPLIVKFYPEKNVKQQVFHRKMSRFALIALIVNSLIALIYFLDISGFELKRIGAFFGHSNTTSLNTSQPSIHSTPVSSDSAPSFFAGHSYPINPAETPLTHEEHVSNYLRNGFNSPKDSAILGYYGIDVSHWQNSINWTKVHADTAPSPLKFFIVKATQGTTGVDPYFKHNWANAKTTETTVGAYHFYLFDEDPKLQAAHFIKTVPLENGDFLPIIDIEPAFSSCGIDGISTAKLIANLTIFLSEIEAHFDQKPILYTYSSFHAKYLKGAFDDYLFWIAKYAQQPPAGFPIQGTTTQKPIVAMWQFSSAERIGGIVGNVDMSFIPNDLFPKMIYGAP